MLDFLKISTRSKKNGVTEVYPKFIIKKSADLMIRGGDFYAIWMEEENLWSLDEQNAIALIDQEVKDFYEKMRDSIEGNVVPLYLWDSSSGMIDFWHKYCQKQMRDNFHQLDEKLIFANTKTKKSDYATKTLPYALEDTDISAYDRLMNVLYAPEEREKIEWAIGAIVSGDSKTTQKFVVLYGEAGTGKSTVLNIIQQLFDGYYGVFDAKALGSANNVFALEAFKANPLVAIQHDGNLSKIEDNTRLNSLVSHEIMTVNEKFKSTYSTRFNAFLFMGTNDPVRITNAKSGILRRLIDVTPTGSKVPAKEYRSLVRQISFELGGIAKHCLDIYQKDPGKYDSYVPISMLDASNDFYNFISDSYFTFKQENGTTLKSAWEMYKSYCEDAKVPYPYSRRVFKEELKNYFDSYEERGVLPDGSRVRNYFKGFRDDRFGVKVEEKEDFKPLIFSEQPSKFDDEYADCPAQYATDKETPSKKWDNITTTLRDLDTHKLHYVKVPKNHIVIDFDLKDAQGNKDFSKNLEEASKFPPTYAELSKSGGGIHLHYIYKGDVSKLSRVYSENIEVKVFSGKSSLRRKLTKCNALPVATISSGLPLKEESKVINEKVIKSERQLRSMIKKNLNKEYHPSTRCSIDFIDKLLTEAYESDLNYDVSDMRTAVLSFAANSTHQADYCIKLVSKMHFKSKEPSVSVPNDDADLVFYDVEVFPNLFLINWKSQGEDQKVVRMINPKPHEIEDLIKMRLVGFNCRRYDNHILYGCLIGYTNEQLYELSQKIISGDRNAFFGEAYNISYTDVYDFCSKKQSLKKWEIELGIHHKELGLPWDQPVPEEKWVEVAEYCDNDVIATEAVFDARQGDFAARQILARLAGGCVNDTTNQLSTKIIFGKNKHPQDQFNYRFMGDVPPDAKRADIGDEYTLFDSKGHPIFPGYSFDHGKSIYRGVEVGEGGNVYAEPGMYTNVALLDIASMHPSSIIAENLFGDTYTKRFSEIKQARVYVKHHDFENAKKMLDGKLTEFIEEIENGEAWFTPEDLAQAFKIVINSIYGLTAATFDNPFRDSRNKDNIVAKRGALFMENLKHVVRDKGFTVAHIKTDSIKIPDATPEIIQFIMDYGKLYGYSFEHEATYEKMCLVNDAVYIAKYSSDEKVNGKHAGEWTATGAQFQVPYVFKTLFTHEPIDFYDECETKSVSTAIYLDMNEGYPDVRDAEEEFANRTYNLKENQKKKKLNPAFDNMSDEDLLKEIDKGHNYIFVGKVGQFTPVKPGCNGGILLRNKDNKYYAVGGTKGYRWLESEMAKGMDRSCIDTRYYNALVDEAVESMKKFGDVEWFMSNEE